MATATHTFVELRYQDKEDGTIDKEEFELADDVKPISLKAYNKEVQTA